MDFAADLSVMFADFGEQATHTPTGGSAITARVIVSHASQDVLGLSMVDVPVITWRVADFGALARGAQIVVGATTWRLREAAQAVGPDRLVYSAPVEEVA